MWVENIPEFADYRNIRAFVCGHLAMQFGDVRSMLRLPLRLDPPEESITHGCNFAGAATLCNLISGVSVVLYNRATASTRGDRGARFRGLLRAYYPWQPGEECDPKIDALYDIVRNPLAHALGVLEPGTVPLSIDKGEGMTAEQVHALETAHDNGVQLPMAVEMVEGRWRVRVPFLYAGCLELLRRLARDRAQMQQTEQVFAAGA